MSSCDSGLQRWHSCEWDARFVGQTCVKRRHTARAFRTISMVAQAVREVQHFVVCFLFRKQAKTADAETGVPDAKTLSIHEPLFGQGVQSENNNTPFNKPILILASIIFGRVIGVLLCSFFLHSICRLLFRDHG